MHNNTWYRKGRPLLDAETLFAENKTVAAPTVYGPIDVGTGRLLGSLNVMAAPAADGNATFVLQGAEDAAGTTKVTLATLKFDQPEHRQALSTTFDTQHESASVPLRYLFLSVAVTGSADLIAAYVSDRSIMPGEAR